MSSCALCEHAYDSSAHTPKVMPCCLRGFCLACLMRQESLDGIVCPGCGDVVANKAKLLPTDSILMRVIESGSMDSEAPSGKAVYEKCMEHGGEVIKLFCETCDQAICAICRLRGHPKPDHVTYPLKEAARRQKESLQETVDEVEVRLAQMSTGLRLLDTIGDDLLTNRDAAKAAIALEFSEMKKDLARRKKLLDAQCDAIAEAELAAFAAKRAAIETTTGPIEVGLSFANRALLHGTPAEIYDTKIMVEGWLQELPAVNATNVEKGDANVKFTPVFRSEVTTCVESYGEVVDGAGRAAPEPRVASSPSPEPTPSPPPSKHTSPSPSTTSAKKKKKPKAKSKPKAVTNAWFALYDYTAADETEVSFAEGDMIINVAESESGWKSGTVASTGQTGMMPANYIGLQSVEA